MGQTEVKKFDEIKSLCIQKWDAFKSQTRDLIHFSGHALECAVSIWQYRRIVPSGDELFARNRDHRKGPEGGDMFGNPLLPVMDFH